MAYGGPPVRILYIHQYFKTPAGSGSTRSFEFARRWVHAGHTVTLITGVTDRSDISSDQHISRHNVEGIHVLAINTRYSNYMSFLRRITAFFDFMFWATWVGMRHVGPVDVILATSTPLTVGIPGYLLSLWKRAPFVFEIRDLWPEAPVQLRALRNPLAIWLARSLERFLYRVAAHIVTLSPGMLDALRRMGVPEHKLSMIPNCCDLDLFAPREPSAAILEQYGLQGRFVALYAGAMGSANGLGMVVETARVLQCRGSAVHLLLIGDGKEKPVLEKLAAHYQLANITFLPWVPKSDLVELMAMADLCLVFFAPLPVLETSSPNKFFDALALGRPILINYGGWMRELLDQHQAGVAVPSNDPQEMADAMMALQADPSRLREMGRHARALAEREFDRDQMSRKFELLLEGIVQSRRGSRGA
jgi:glycosyltransferase involved in cell wall biosynthesis